MQTEKFYFLTKLNSKQREICESTDNYILTACPGSGKTYTIIYRIAYLQQKYEGSRLLNIAITYTNRAAEEIEHRLLDMDIDMKNIWIGTIHQFCMKFIIRPYAMHSERLRKGYRIIDEYEQLKYVRLIAAELGIDYRTKDILLNPKVKEKYDKLLNDRKEIDFDLILYLSKELIKKNSFIAQNISFMIRSIHVDEFQDTNELQYEIIAELIKSNNRINILFVGDVNQAIYSGLGGVAKSYEEISHMCDVDFKQEILNGCYRSSNRIIDYYRNFEVNETGVVSVSKNKDIYGIIKYNTNVTKDNVYSEIADIINVQINNGIKEKEICVIAPQWYQIYPLSNRLKSILPTIKFDAPNVSPFKINPMNPFYLMAKLLFMEAGIRVSMRKRIAAEIINIFKTDYQVFIPEIFDEYNLLKILNAVPINYEDGVEMYKDAVSTIINTLKIDSTSEKSLLETYNSFMNEVTERIKKNNIPFNYMACCNCFKEKEGVVVNTIHGIKGEEYTTVIAFDLLNGHLPHWDYIMDKHKKAYREVETKKLLYVLCSRAKQNLYLFSERGRKTKNGYEYTATDELTCVDYVYD